MTDKLLRILHLEDKRSDAEIVQQILQKNFKHCTLKWVDNKGDYLSALKEFKPQVVLCEHSLATFNSVEAFELLKSFKAKVRIPFILVSSSVSEPFALETLRAGVEDYVLKDRLQRLPYAIEKALVQVESEEARGRYMDELLSNERRYRALIENITDGIVLGNEQGLVIYNSPSVFRITGLTDEQTINRSIFEFISKEDLNYAREIFSKAIQNPGVPVYGTIRIIKADGSMIYAEGTIINLLKDEWVKAVIINYRDVTQKIESEIKRNKLESTLSTIVNNTRLGYVQLDVNKIILSFNERARQMFKKEFGQAPVEGRLVLTYLPDKRAKRMEKLFDKVMNGERIRYDISFKDSSKGLNWYHVNVFPVFSIENQVDGVILSTEDITQRKNSEIESKQMTGELIQHNKNLEQFAYIVSHNLRAWVANIIGLSTLLESSLQLAPEEFERCVSGIGSSVRKLDEIIGDLNQILKKRNEPVEQKERGSLNEVLEDIKLGFTTELNSGNVEIHSQFEVEQLYSVKGYVHSIFYNLISNSIKYKKAKEACRVLVSSAIVKQQLVLKFEDNGLGMDLEAIGDKLFGLYKKFHTHVEGKGLGLYMVKSQVEILKGKIHVESTLRKGTSFIISLPMHHVV